MEATGAGRATGAAGTTSAPESPETARERLVQLLGVRIPRYLVYVAAKLGLAEHLAAGPLSAGDIAAALGAHPDTLRRVLRGMVAAGLLTQADDGRFALDEVGRLLRRDAPEPLVGRLIKSVELEMAWSGLLHGVLTGEPPFEHVFGDGVFDRFAGDPATAALGAALNPGTTWEVAQAIAAAYDWSPFGTVVDVGGGDGTVLAAILQRHPHLTGAVLDRPHVVGDARRVAAHHGVDARCEVVPGDFFAAVPPGDVYLLKTVLHDWDDARAGRILQQCRAAMRPRGRVVVVETLLPEVAVQGSGGFLGDVMMLVETGGRERTEREFRALFATAGFTLAAVRPLPPGVYHGRCLIEGVPGGSG